MITIQRDTVAQWAADAPELYRAHWKELGLDQDLEIAPDIASMQTLESLGKWLVISVRDDGKLIGYLLALVSKHLHYSTSPLMFIVDAYYVMPEYRRGNGTKLLKFAEATARSLGAIKMYLTCKVHEDHSELFTRFGYRLSDYAFIKRI